MGRGRPESGSGTAASLVRHGRTPPRPVRWWRKRGRQRRGRGQGGCRGDHTGLPGSAPAILDALGRLGARPGALRRIVLTHSRVDHMGSAADLVDATGARVLARADDVPCVSGAAPAPPSVHTPAERALHEQVMAGLARAELPPLRHLPVDVALHDGDTLDDGREPVRVLHVPVTPRAVARSICPAAASCSPATSSARGRGARCSDPSRRPGGGRRVLPPARGPGGCGHAVRAARRADPYGRAGGADGGHAGDGPDVRGGRVPSRGPWRSRAPERSGRRRSGQADSRASMWKVPR
ncbi:MBL fold metallo-hydrolase [Streptomyces sp. NPDC101393]|uniref:MBL fold metallo-hydrolase n=1 Tax=Streptomyces sp. NPDC101393 TaxID=3366141 RepID=UPI00380E75DB